MILTDEAVPFHRSSVDKQQKDMLMSRTNFKQQLMREHMQLLEEREKKGSLQEKQCASSAPSLTTPAVRVPLQSSPQPPNVPRQVLMVKTRLENPTPYHVKESQQRQVQQYLSQSHLGTKAHTFPTSPPQVSNSLDPSPSSPLSAAYSSTATSPTELEEFWQDFKNLPSVSDSVADSGVDQGPPLNAAEAANIFDVLSFIPGISNISSSCPAGLEDVSEEGEILSDEKAQAFQKDRQKKDNHNRIERRRRFNINDRIKELGTLLPKNNDPYYDVVRDVKQNKGTILKASVDYVKCLKKEVGKIPELEKMCRLQEQLNRRLLVRIQYLEHELEKKGVTVSQPAWRPAQDLQAIIRDEPLLPRGIGSAPTNTSNIFPPFTAQSEQFPRRQQRQQDLKPLSSQAAKSAPTCGGRVGFPIVQFLTVKQEPRVTPSSSPCSNVSPPCTPPIFSQFEELIMEDDIPVTGDPMLSSSDAFSPERMDFMS